MQNVLIVHSSPTTDHSTTRTLARHFQERLQTRFPNIQITERDLARQPLPHLDELTIGAFYTAPDQRTEAQKQAIATSEMLVNELLAAQTIVIGAPMHNFSISSGLKAWIDHIARAGRTFRYTDKGPEGLVSGKKVYVLAASGGYYESGSAAETMNHVDPYLKTVLGFLGMTDITFIHAWGMASGEEGLMQAQAQIDTLLSAS